ncbi:YwqJ-related putative deaminase, partial [Streptomyces sp. NPDC088812]|uniref:YwqJ-related putative deaminase n=1 Tax=Streptomyces sp. NPDC088812 TaxID=3365905 RepID=UPI0038008A42
GDIPAVHAGADLPGSGAGSHLPGGTADHLPGGTADHLPGGTAGDNLPGGSAHEHGAGPFAGHEPPTGHTEGTGDGPNGHPADGGRERSDAGGHESASDGHGGDVADTGHGDGSSGHGSDRVGDGHTGDGGTPHDHTDHGGHEADPRDVREPRGSLADDAARRAADPIQIGDQPMPSPATGENSLGRLPESRVQRDADGLITHVDGRDFEHFLKDLSYQRGAAFREAKELGTLSRRQVGACAGQVMDLRTGNIVEGINGKADNVIPPDRVHPTLAANLDALPDPVPGYDHPLGHAEVKAVNELLWERTKLGLPDGPSALGELRAAVEFPYTPHMDTQLPGRPAPFCVNCHHMLKDVDSLHGRFTAKDADDSNWIP